jgi:hypothetical protein
MHHVGASMLPQRARGPTRSQPLPVWTIAGGGLILQAQPARSGALSLLLPLMEARGSPCQRTPCPDANHSGNESVSVARRC